MKTMKLSDKQINALLDNVKNLLKNSKYTTDKVSFSADIPKPIRPKAQLIITEIAYSKMRALVLTQDKEIGWHGTVTRTKKANVTTYKIEDIFVFPQSTTAATVVADQSKYSNWLYAPEQKPIFHTLRFHGHSHVNMACRPSGVDTEYQRAMTETLQDFYIFGIFNKRDENWMQIFDVLDNVIYEDTDIELTIEGDMSDWANGMAKEHVHPVLYAPAINNTVAQTQTVAERTAETIATAKATATGKVVGGRQRTVEEQKKYDAQFVETEELEREMARYDRMYKNSVQEDDEEYKYFGRRN